MATTQTNTKKRKPGLVDPPESEVFMLGGAGLRIYADGTWSGDREAFIAQMSGSTLGSGQIVNWLFLASLRDDNRRFD